MGVRFRKSKKIGPLRINISKSGVSYSVGVKGARITKRADGKIQTTTSIPGTGISNVTVYNNTTQARSTPQEPKKKEFLDTWYGKLITLGIIIGATIAVLNLISYI